MIRILLFWLVLLSWPVESRAGAWVQPRGSSYVKLSYSRAEATRVFGSGQRPEFDGDSVYFYGEYGVDDRVTAILSLPVAKRSVNRLNSVQGTTEGFLSGDIEPAVRIALGRQGWVSSVQLGLKIPVEYSIDHRPPFGNGQWDFDLKALVARSLYPRPAYVTADVGYRMRGGTFVDELHANLEFGHDVHARVMARALISAIENLGSASEENDLFGFPLEQEQLRLGGGIILRLDWGLELDVAFLQTVDGLNIPRTFEVFVGIARKSP